MSIFYIDTSALMKRYLREAGTRWIDELLEETSVHQLFSTDLASVELIAAITRAYREKRISEKRRDAAIFQISHEWRVLVVPVTVSSRVVTVASEVTLRYPLRAYDAVHLATAIIVRQEGQAHGFEPPVVLAADRTLLAAATVEGFETENPNDHP